MKDNDPDVLADLRQKVEQAKAAANRWTGMLEVFCSNKNLKDILPFPCT